MDKNFIIPTCKSAVGKTLFYIFEVSALVLGVIMLIMAIYTSAQTASFLVFVNGFVSAVSTVLVVYGIGKLIDLLYLKSDNGTGEKKITKKVDTAKDESKEK